MSGYLQRLVARAMPMNQGAVQPFVRTASPIAARDQRFGLAGFEAAGLTASRTTRGESDGSVALSAAPWAPKVSRTAADGGMHQNAIAAPRETASPASDSDSRRASASGQMPPRRSAATPHEDGRAEQLVPEPGAVHLRTASPAARPIIRTPYDPGWPRAATDGVDDERAASEGPRERRTGMSQVAEEWVAADAYTPTPPAPRVQLDPADLVQPRPRRDAMAEDLDASTFDLADRGRRPRVEIGAIQVEVVPPPASRETGPRSPTGPMTANSVSRIGPLAARRRSNLRYAMRVG